MKKILVILSSLLVIKTYSFDLNGFKNHFYNAGFTNKTEEFEEYKDIYFKKRSGTFEEKIVLFYSKNNIKSIDIISTHYNKKLDSDKILKNLNNLVYEFNTQIDNNMLKKDTEKVLKSIQDNKNDLIETNSYIIRGFNLGMEMSINIELKKNIKI